MKETLRCECDCTQLRVEDFEGDMVSIVFETSYLGKENGWFKRVWNAMRGKETYYAEVIQDRKVVANWLRKVVKELDDEKS